jgi:predicted transposase YbfD/YdcC
MIIEGGNDYLVKVKGNQPTLLAALQQTAEDMEPIEVDRQVERGRGRRAERHVALYRLPKGIDPAWKARRMVAVTRSGWREGQAYRRVSYYLTSRVDTAVGFAAGIRTHWAVENGLHWTKDALMNEDGSRIRSPEAATTLSLLKSLALTRYRRAGYTSLKTATTRFANKVKELLQLLRT